MEPSRDHSSQLQSSDHPCPSPKHQPLLTLSTVLGSGVVDAGSGLLKLVSMALGTILHCFLSEVPSMLYGRANYLMSHSHGIFGGWNKVLCSTRDLQLGGYETALALSQEKKLRHWTPGANITLFWGVYFIIDKCHWGLMPCPHSLREGEQVITQDPHAAI